MKSLLIFSVFCFSFFSALAQQAVGKASAVMQAPLISSTSQINNTNQWNIALNIVFEKGHGVPNKKSFDAQKQISANKLNFANATLPIKKTRATSPIIGTNFRGNKTEFLTPTDNGFAISNGGKIVSVDNCTIEYYNENGTAIQQGTTWNDFLGNDSTLLLGKYDPRVIYDNVHDRFITMILHGPVNQTKNKIIIAYSKTNNPVDGWNIYKINGNPFNDTSFSDYPNIGITDNELFINLNLFKCVPPYNYNQTVIYQISLANGYSGAANLNYKVWGDGITTSTGLPGFTLVPAANGLGQASGPNMWFVSTWPDGNDSFVYAYQLTKEMMDTTGQLLQYTYKIPKFKVCANGKIKNPVNGLVDSISTGSSIVQSAFILDSMIHFTFDADFNNGWCGINYGKINLKTNKAQVTQYGVTGTYLCYPAIASLGKNATDQNVVLAYVQADTNILPQTCMMGADELMNFSLPKVVKKGDTIVDILTAANNPGYAERWGDYTGIHRRFTNTSGVPEVWMAGAYGATNARPASYNTWLAQILSATVFPTATTSVQNKNTTATVFPNPISNVYGTRFVNSEKGNVVISIINLNGQKIQDVYNGEMPIGECNMQFNKGMLANGIYFLQITRDNAIVFSQKIEVQ